jgi:hypothetical protein
MTQRKHIDVERVRQATDSSKDSKKSAEFKAVGWSQERSNYGRGGVARKLSLWRPRGSQKLSLHAQAVRGRLQYYLPSPQVRAAPDQVSERNWNLGKNNLMFDHCR